MSRNVDILAVGLLLVGIALYSHTRKLVTFAINSHEFGFTHYSRTIIVPPVAPAPPPLPHLRVMRD